MISTALEYRGGDGSRKMLGFSHIGARAGEASAELIFADFFDETPMVREIQAASLEQQGGIFRNRPRRKYKFVVSAVPDA